MMTRTEVKYSVCLVFGDINFPSIFGFHTELENPALNTGAIL